MNTFLDNKKELILILCVSFLLFFLKWALSFHFFVSESLTIKIINESYIIDELSIFMKILTLLFCLFVLLCSKDYLKINNIDKIVHFIY